MKPRAFEYYAPVSLDQAVELLVEHGEEARPLAGGQSLVPLMNLRMASPAVLVDLNRISSLRYIRRDGDAIALGAMARYVDVQRASLIKELFPILVQATDEVGYVGVRSRGTIGGAIAHADPVAEWPVLAMALDAEMVAIGPDGRRAIPAADFFRGLYETALEPGELLTEVRLPVRADRGGWAFREFARKVGDYALVAVAVELGAVDGTISRARVALSNLSDRPVRAFELERACEGCVTSADVEELIAAVPDTLGREHPLPDELAMRANIAATLTARALAEAFSVARNGRDE